MSKLFRFGEDVPGYEIPVLNEREIRAAAGILFVWAFTAVLAAIMKGSFLLLKYFILAFLVDFLIRVLINPKYAPTLIIGRLIVRRQTPEYVGAAQKKFCMGYWVGAGFNHAGIGCFSKYLQSYFRDNLLDLPGLFAVRVGIWDMSGMFILRLVLRKEGEILSWRSLRD